MRWLRGLAVLLLCALPLSAAGYWQSRSQVAISVASGPTFDPAKKSSHITLSGGNLVATSGAGSTGSTNVFSVTSHATGKYYVEFTLTAKGGGDYQAVGVSNSTQAPDDGNLLGGTLNSVGFYNVGFVYLNFSLLATFVPYAAGAVICMAVDIDNNRIWFRINGGQWNSNGGGDPTLGAGGVPLDISARNAGALFVVAEGDVSGDVWTVNLGGSGYAQTKPSGYSDWN